ncbi:HAD family hydrolase [Fictibacillus sp. WQ 8-8]|uniref:HAD-IIB family hydrolase n=1 Tax=unclassified Fictibacillus TaxID=2644029 RepID=UPI00210C80DA|nr:MULTISPECIES: HAD-IIB family hydrolase [unclassified Fictibacillus]MCQ6266125.1 HAD family hydrolase [Fictibacillus sp. WQ 8-8]MED2972655.1 HAD-IIB family hydrolase [Fictibacillus sp. B-59209]
MKRENVTHLLATDLDGTLVGEKELTSLLFDYYKERPYNVQLVYVTGRHYASTMELIKEEELPMPSILISDVGTEMYDLNDPELHERWKKTLEEKWNPAEISRIVQSCSGLTPQSIPSVHRLSYFAESDEAVEEVKQKLSGSSVPHKLIFSSGRDVDILPPNAGKGEALSFLLREKGWEKANVLVAGDSGNDRDMITLGYPAVVVGNCQKELKQLPDHPMIFRAQKHCAGGIHEAWEHFFEKTPVKNSI